MQRSTVPLLFFVGFLTVSLVTDVRSDCGSGGSTTITNVPTLGGTMINIFALGPSGHVGGYSGLPGNDIIDAFVLNKNGSVANLGTFGGSFGVVNAINSSGYAVGRAFTANDAESHAFISTNGLLSELGSLGGTFSSGEAVNASGQVAGSANLTGDATQHAFRYSAGVMTDLGSLGGDYSSGVAINSSGVVVGDSYDPSFNQFGYVCTNTNMVSVGDLGGGYYSSARVINDSGLVVGEAATSDGTVRGFAYFNGTISDLGDLGSGYSSATGVNNAGQIIGTSYDAAFAQHGFVYSNGVMTDLGTLANGTTIPLGINNHGQIVGNSLAANSQNHGFIWQDGVMTDLNLLLPTNSGWQLMSAQYINDSGRIVGFGVLNGSFSWYVLDLASGSANNPPVAHITPTEQTVNCQSSAVLDGSSSSDPDGSTLRFEWRESGALLGTNATLNASLGLGTHYITLRVTDPCDAVSETNAVVNVVDTNAPVIVGGPAPITVNADANCLGAVPNIVSGIVATDTCTPTNLLVITQDPPAGALLGLGQHTIIVTVKDGSGNTTQGSTYYTVVDATPPVIVGLPAPLTLPAGSDCSAVVPNVTSAVVATDACTPANQLVVTQSPAAGAKVPCGTNTIVVTVKDAAGNTATAGVQLIVVDTTAPVITSLPGPITLNTDGHCPTDAPNVSNRVVATDNCTPARRLVVTQSPAAGTHLPLGTNVIVVTVTDASGNSTTGNVIVIVRDTSAPVIRVLGVDPKSISPPNHRMVPVTISLTAADNFDPQPNTRITSITCNESVLPSAMVITGPLTASLEATRNGGGRGRCYTITVTSTDVSGNSSTATTFVNVPH